MNFGSLSLISWILMINSDSGSTCRPVFLSIALARRMYRDFSSLSNFFAAWMSPVFSSIMNTLPAPSPVNMYFKFPSPLSWSVWSFREVKKKKEFYKYMHCYYRKNNVGVNQFISTWQHWNNDCNGYLNFHCGKTMYIIFIILKKFKQLYFYTIMDQI